MNESPRRKQLRLGCHDYTQECTYFITICTAQQTNNLAELMCDEDCYAFVELSPIGEIVKSVLFDVCKRYNSEIVSLTVMPNHLHFILYKMNSDKITLGNIIGAFKSITTRLVNEEYNTPGKKLWQRNYFEHIVRNSYEYQKIISYIQSDPQNHLDKLWDDADKSDGFSFSKPRG